MKNLECLNFRSQNRSMLVKNVIDAIESYAPAIYQESYDNSGLQVGNMEDEVNGVLISLDITEDILNEAIERGCNMVVAHHPLLFCGLKRIAGKTYIERIVQKAIKNDINLYAAHTNLDNVYNGVNAKIAEKLGLQQTAVLAPMGGTLCKLYTYVPYQDAEKVREALFAAGGGGIGQYSECSFNSNGNGTFRPGAGTNPAIGHAGGPREWVEEVKIELILQKDKEAKVLKALFEAHPYEEVAYEIVALQNKNQELGAGMIGNLPKAMDETTFLGLLKQQMKTDCIRHTVLSGKKIQKVAVCGGSGSFLLPNAIGAGADIFITGDFKYHQFFDADGKLIIADIGHYESEQFTLEIFQEILRKKFPNFATLLSNLSTNPVKYFC